MWFEGDSGRSDVGKQLTLNAYMDIILRLLGFSGVLVGFGEGV